MTLDKQIDEIKKEFYATDLSEKSFDLTVSLRIKSLIAKAVKNARIDGLLMAKYGTKDNSFEEKFIDNLIQQLNTDKKIDMSIQSEIVDLTYRD